MGVKIELDTKRLDEILAILQASKETALIVHDGTEYGLYVEMGTAPHGKHPGTSPQPFMAPAVEAVRKGYEKGIRQAIERGGTTLDLFIAKIAHDVEAHAKARVPVDTGNLKNSITVSNVEQFARIKS